MSNPEHEQTSSRASTAGVVNPVPQSSQDDGSLGCALTTKECGEAIRRLTQPAGNHDSCSTGDREGHHPPPPAASQSKDQAAAERAFQHAKQDPEWPEFLSRGKFMAGWEAACRYLSAQPDAVEQKDFPPDVLAKFNEDVFCWLDQEQVGDLRLAECQAIADQITEFASKRFI